ncbi:MAG: hypothetical protein Q9170_008303 [Blastenia crenularia]
MPEDVLLTELCTICHTNPYKYCCPRCSSRTCSLPCIKRHKQWASCSGIRDPAAYIKRSDLATPKGIDHDYNYLTSIERQFDLAERDFESRGVLLYDETQDSRKGQNPAKGKVSLERAIKQCRVVVDRAPKGMTRQKQNATYWDKRSKRIIWMIEWVHKDGSREIGQCPDTEPIETAYTKIVSSGKQEEGTKVKRPKKKRKKNAEVPRPATLAQAPQPKQPPVDPASSPAAPVSPVRPQISESPTPSALEHQQPMSSVQDKSRPGSSADTSRPSPPRLHFYLLLPSTPTPYRVLVPLAPTDSLVTTLKDRLVLEFPTIYALKHPPERLPAGFMTEEEYLKNMIEKGNLNQQLDGLLNMDGGFEHEVADRSGKQDLDEGALRAVLSKDLVREVDAG